MLNIPKCGHFTLLVCPLRFLVISAVRRLGNVQSFKHTCFAFELFAMNATPARRVTPSWHIYMANCCNEMHLCKWVSMRVGSVLECVPCARVSNQIIVYTSPNYRNKINSATHSESLQLSPRLTGLPYLADRATRLGGSPHLSCKRDQNKIRNYRDGRVTSPTWGPPPPCKQALRLVYVRGLLSSSLNGSSNCTGF